jgi:hypothetical protein
VGGRLCRAGPARVRGGASGGRASSCRTRGCPQPRGVRSASAWRASGRSPPTRPPGAALPAATAAARVCGQAVGVAHMAAHVRGTAHYALKAVALTHADDAASAVALEDEWQRRHLLRGSPTSSTRLRDLTCHAPVSAAGLHAGRGATAQGRACSHFRALRERIQVRRLNAYLGPRRSDVTCGKGGPHSGYRQLADKDEAGGSSPPRPTSGSDEQECWSAYPRSGG